MHAEIENYAAFGRMLRREGRDVEKALNDGMKQEMEGAAVAARGFARSKSGKMRGSIRPYAKRGEAGIRARATRRGYSYAARQEFDPRMGGSFMRRAVATTVDLNDVLNMIKRACERAWRM